MDRARLPILAPLLILVSLARAQEEHPPRTEFQESLHRTADSLVAAQRAYADTLISHGAAATAKALEELGSCIGTLVRDSADSLDGEARNRLRFTELGMRTTLGVLGYPARGAVRAVLGAFEKDLPVLEGKRSACSGCTSPGQFAAARRLFAHEADSLSGFCADSMATLVESWEDALDDSVVAFTDSILYQIELLKSGFAEKDEPRLSRLVVSGAYATHASYRGRDNGITQSAFGPSVTYHHRSGVFIGGALGWTSQPTPGPDDGSLTAGFEFDVSPEFDGSVSYTHFWYSDSSTKPQAVTNQNVEAMFTFDARVVNLLADLSYDFGGGTGGAAFTTSLDVSKDILVPEKTLGGMLMLSPTVSATWGDQDERLLERRLQRLKKKVVVVRSIRPSSVFGIMAYEFSFPARLHVGAFSFEPAFEYVIPADVLDSGRALLNRDPSTTAPFVSVAMTVTMTVE